MFCKECGKRIDDDSKFCSHCGTKQSVEQVTVNPLEGTPKADTINKNVNISLSFKKPTFRDENIKDAETKVDKYDKTYQKEIEATFVALGVLVIQIIIYLVDPYEYGDNPQKVIAIIALVNFLWRIITTVWIVNISGRQNRDTTGWGIFAFFLPNLALFIIGLLKKLNKQPSTQTAPETNENPNIDETRNGLNNEEIDLSKKYTFKEEILSQWTNFWGKEQIEYRIDFSDGNIGKIYNIKKDGKFEKCYVKFKNYRIYYRSKEAAIKALHYVLTTYKILRSDDYLYME